MECLAGKGCVAPFSASGFEEAGVVNDGVAGADGSGS